MARKRSGQAPPLVAIEWEDSAQAAPQWQWLADLTAPGVVRCVSVGFLVRDDAREKALAISLAAAGDPVRAQASGVISIPTRSVVRIRRLSGLSSAAACGRAAASGRKPPGT